MSKKILIGIVVLVLAVGLIVVGKNLITKDGSNIIITEKDEKLEVENNKQEEKEIDKNTEGKEEVEQVNNKTEEKNNTTSIVKMKQVEGAGYKATWYNDNTVKIKLINYDPNATTKVPETEFTVNNIKKTITGIFSSNFGSDVSPLLCVTYSDGTGGIIFISDQVYFEDYNFEFSDLKSDEGNIIAFTYDGGYLDNLTELGMALLDDGTLVTISSLIH